MLELFVGVCVGALITAAAWVVADTGWKHDTVQRGLAVYCQTDGRWAWVGECGE